MRFDDKITFPYPVLGVRNDIMPLPDFNFETLESDCNYIFHIKIDINNPSIKYYIDTRYAEYVCEVDCKRTFYRVCFTSRSPLMVITIPKNTVSGEVNITLTVNTSMPIKDYSNLRANDAYTGYTFDLEPGDILAYIGSLTIHTDIMSDEYKAVGSFLHFSKGKPGAEISYYLGGQDIEIILPSEMFESYTKKLKGNQYRAAIMASIVNEALIYALTQYHNHVGSRWARLLSAAEVLADFDFEGEIDVLTAIEMTRMILKQPHNVLFATLVDMMEEDE